MSFTPSFESLRTFECPDWFRDAKFGIWSHWGPQSVPMYGDWYARNMYLEGSPQYLYHIRHYGHPSKFGYKDVCALWKAENFDPDALMELYVKAGARYFVAQAMHHDHFFNYPSKLNRMNSAEVGPKRDIVGAWKSAADKHGLPFGLTEHLGASFSWWRVNKGHDKTGPYAGVPYDGNDPAWRDFYYDNFEHVEDDMENCRPWYTENERFHRYWNDCMHELIDLYEPDMLYSDGSLPFGKHWDDGAQAIVDSDYADGLDAVAYLYNKSSEKYGKSRAIYTQKDRRAEIYSVGVLDIEKSQLPGIADAPWQTDTCIGNWFYDVRQKFKTANHVIKMLVDIISKNGSMLLNILQKPDGTIDDETRYLLGELADWFAVCGEGVYGTRPFRVAGEGETKVVIKNFVEEQAPWTGSDIRFTRKGSTVYAFLLGRPENGVAVVKSLTEGERVRCARLLGFGELPFSQSFGVVAARLPDKLPAKYANCVALELE